MARLSRQRRNLAKLADASKVFKAERSREGAKEMAMLQQGSPTNHSGAKFARVSGLPRPFKQAGVEGEPKPVDWRKRPKAEPRDKIDWQHDQAYIDKLKADYLAKGGKI